MFCGGFKIAAKNQKIPKIQNIMLASWNQDYGHSANFIHTFPFQLIHFPNALWVYPNVNGSVRNFSQDTPPPFFLIQLFQRKYLCYNLATVLLSLHICSTSWQETPSYMFFLHFPFKPPKFWGRDLPKRPPQIFERMKIESKYLDISNCIFTMNCSTDKKLFSGLF